MLKLNSKIEKDLDSIEYYYDCQDKIKELTKRLNYHKTATEEIQNKIDTINRNVSREITGRYQEMIEFGMENGKPVSRIINKKVEPGRLENLTEFLNERSLEIATRRYLRTKGAELDNRCNILNPEKFYTGKDEFNAYTSFRED